MKKILIYYSYSQKNAGDMAICLGLLDLLSNIPDCQITMVSRYAKNDPLFTESKQMINKYHPSVTIKPGYINFNRNGNFFSKMFAYFHGFFLSSFPYLSKKLRKDIDDCDIVLFNGGNYLRSNSLTDRLRLKALFFPIKYAKKHGKKVICMPQSTAKAKNNASIKRIKKICSLFDYIFVRDPISYAYFVENNICDKSKIFNSCDLAFFTNNNLVLNDRDSNKTSKQINVAINARVTGIGDIGSIDSYKIELIRNTYKRIIKSYPNYNFTFVCQTEKDYKFMKELFILAGPSGSGVSSSKFV